MPLGASHGLLVLTLVVAACSSGAAGSRGDSGATSPATESGGTGVVGGAGQSAGASGQSGGTAGQNAGAVAGVATGGTTGSGTGNMDAAGGTGSSGAPAASGAAGTGGSSVAAGASGGGASGLATSGTGGGVFVMCDDHADFNGRGLCSPTEKFGTVVATEALGGNGGASTTLSASFGLTNPVIDPGCTQETVGAACTADTCMGTSNDRAEPQAGTITASSNGGMIVVTPDANGYYADRVVASALWTMPMAALTFTAAGGVVPAFSETFCGPVSATITKPASPPGVGPGGGLTIDRSADLDVEWTGGAVGDLEIVLTDDSDAATTIAVHCLFTGASGQGTVPKAALAKISAGAHAITSNMWVRKISLPAGTCVEVTGVITNVSTAGGVPFNGDATFL
jgi:hypothetical protein